MAKSADDGILKTLKSRFEKNAHRHKGIEWGEVEKRIAANKGKLKALAEMESTGGEPDVVGVDKASGFRGRLRI
jgi:hypothetical protein